LDTGWYDVFGYLKNRDCRIFDLSSRLCVQAQILKFVPMTFKDHLLCIIQLVLVVSLLASCNRVDPAAGALKKFDQINKDLKKVIDEAKGKGPLPDYDTIQRYADVFPAEALFASTYRVLSENVVEHLDSLSLGIMTYKNDLTDATDSATLKDYFLHTNRSSALYNLLLSVHRSGALGVKSEGAKAELGMLFAAIISCKNESDFYDKFIRNSDGLMPASKIAALASLKQLQTVCLEARQVVVHDIKEYIRQQQR
jgi:hypothetical protein